MIGILRKKIKNFIFFLIFLQKMVYQLIYHLLFLLNGSKDLIKIYDVNKMAKISIEDVKVRLMNSDNINNGGKPVDEEDMITESTNVKPSKKKKKDKIEFVEAIDENLVIFKKNKSYVLSVTDDKLNPVIGEFDEMPKDKSMPPCMKDWLDTYSKEVNYFQENEEELMTEYAMDELSTDADGDTYGSIELIDLGLSVKWANMNIGASTIEDVGNYYAWGEVETKTDYTIAKYNYYDASTKTYKDIGKSIANSEYDVAHKMYGELCMPTMGQAKELFTKCTWTKIKLNGVNGWEVKGPNGNSIFIPINGCKSESSKVSYTSYTYFWTSDATSNAHQANTAKITDAGTIYQMYKRTGAAIRAVESKVSSKENDIKFVDLGLSVNWADTNLGASKPEEYGDYYAWAELEPKDNYTWATYKYYVKVPEEYINIGKDIQKSAYDQAYALSKTMCIPTEAQWKELQSKCKFTEKTVDNIIGYEVTGPNGNSIFIPFVGNTYDGKTGDVNVNGYYHSSTLAGTDYQFKAAKFGVKNIKSIVDLRKRTGSSIRPIASGETATSDEKTLNIKFIDLGLSVKWGDMNLGATKPSDKGDYYAWGDSEANKKSFTWAAYKYYKAQIDQSQDLGKTITQNLLYDVAYVKNNDMCIPEVSHWKELIEKCTWTETTKNNVKGYEVKGPNGNSIFLPNAGYKLDKKLYYGGTQGIYTTASYYSTNISQYRSTCDWKTGGKPAIAGTRKRAGTTIRPITVKENDLTKGKKTIQPLIPYKWNQSAPYYNECPIDPSTNKRSLTGCTQTALAMVLAYYANIGVNGKKFRRGMSKTAAYTSTRTSPSISVPALPPIAMFDWDNMNFVKAADFKTAESKKAVAELMKYLGHANKATYSSSGTGATPTNAMATAKTKMHFGEGAKLIYASSGVDSFKEQIYKELEAGYPVHFSGWNSEGKSGHAFICDGYDAKTGKFHFNWGWGGSYDGWFDISILKPTSSNDFSYSKRCIIGLHPDYLFGDLNTDNEVTVSDIMNLVQAIVDKKVYDYKNDINSDGKVDENDIMALINYMMGNKI